VAGEAEGAGGAATSTVEVDEDEDEDEAPCLVKGTTTDCLPEETRK